MRTSSQPYLNCSNKTKIPQHFGTKVASLVFNKKGSHQTCGNYRGISHLSIAGKVLKKIIMHHMKPFLNTTIPESQCGFCSARSTIDMIFTIRQLQKKAIEQNMPIYSIFYSLTWSMHTTWWIDTVSSYSCKSTVASLKSLVLLNSCTLAWWCKLHPADHSQTGLMWTKNWSRAAYLLHRCSACISLGCPGTVTIKWWNLLQNSIWRQPFIHQTFAFSY